MINGIKKGTIVSTTEDRLTLLNWLKKLEKTLSDDTLTDIAFTGNDGNVSLVLTFEDGTTKSVAFPYDMSEFALSKDLENYATKEDITGMVTESEEITFTPVADSNVTINFSHIVKHGNIVFVHIGVTITATNAGYFKIGNLSVYPNHIHNNTVMLTQSVNDFNNLGSGYANLRDNGEIYIYTTQMATRFYDYNTFFTIGE